MQNVKLEARALRGGALIPLNHGFVTVVDAQDAVLVAGRSWWAQRSGQCPHWYACSKDGERNITMTHLLLGTKPGRYVDHKNGNTLDNRRHNLRWASKAENAWNARAHRDSQSGYKGVHPSGKQSGKWVAQIMASGVRYSLGAFVTPEEAAVAYNEAALRLHGVFARLNEVR